jgi:hypothetical protein
MYTYQSTTHVKFYVASADFSTDFHSLFSEEVNDLLHRTG